MSQSWREIIEQAGELPAGLERVALIEHAVRLADTGGSEQDQYDARLELIEAANYAGCPERVLVAFSWCLAKYDASPNDYSPYTLMWRYKWVSEKLACFPQVARAKIEEMHDDMEQRYRELSYSVRPVHGGRFVNALRMGLIDEAAQHFETYSSTKRDWMSDCTACECDVAVDYLIEKGQYEQAVDEATPILKGKLHCAEVPQLTHATILRPLVLLGRMDQAAEYHEKGYRKVVRDREFLGSIARHLQYLSFIQNDAKAIRLVEQHLPIAMRANDPLRKFQFYVSLHGFYASLAERKPRAKKMMLPSEMPGFREDHRYRPIDLAEQFLSDAKAMAELFDQRNGNDYVSSSIERIRGFCDSGQ